jgi:large subunit ribosomal protein L10
MFNQPAETICMKGSCCLWERRKDLKTRKQKAEEIEVLKDKLARAKGVVFTDFKGLSVAENIRMRAMLRESEIEYRVVKNTLARIAADDTPVAGAKDKFIGPVGIAISYDDPVVLSKKVIDFARGNDKFQITGGVVEGRIVDLDKLKEVANLPHRDVQLAMLVGAMSSPLSKMASLLQATIRKFGYALHALKNAKEE